MSAVEDAAAGRGAGPPVIPGLGAVPEGALWAIYLAPVASFCVIAALLRATPARRGAAHHLRGRAHLGALALGARHGAGARRRAARASGALLVLGRRIRDGGGAPPGRPHRRDAGRRDDGRPAGAGLLHRLHARRSRLRALLRLHVALHRLDARARPRLEPGAALRALGAGGALLLPPDRLLVRPPLRVGGGEEGLHRHPLRRPGLPARGAARGDQGRALRHPGHQRARARGGALGRRAHRLHARPALRRGREERAVPAAHLAPRRDGGPHPGLGADPRGDDGRGRRLPARALLPPRSTPRRPR